MTPALIRARALPIWSGPVDPQPLGGGITNVNFLVEDAGRRVVVRIGDDIPVHGVMRFNELAASRAAHAAGVSPAVVHAEPGALVHRAHRGPDARSRGRARPRAPAAHPGARRPRAPRHPAPPARARR